MPNVQVGQMAKKKNRAARFAPAGEIDMMVVRKCGVEHEHSETCHVVRPLWLPVVRWLPADQRLRPAMIRLRRW